MGTLDLQTFRRVLLGSKIIIIQTMLFGHLCNFILFWGIYIKLLSKSCLVMMLAECPDVHQSAALQSQSLKLGSWTTFSTCPDACSRFRAARKLLVLFHQAALVFVDSSNTGMCVGDAFLVTIRKVVGNPKLSKS